jgi:hypothetical protein
LVSNLKFVDIKEMIKFTATYPLIKKIL